MTRKEFFKESVKLRDNIKIHSSVTLEEKSQIADLLNVVYKDQKIQILKDKKYGELYVPPRYYDPPDGDYSDFDLWIKHDFFHLSEDGNYWVNLSHELTGDTVITKQLEREINRVALFWLITLIALFSIIGWYVATYHTNYPLK